MSQRMLIGLIALGLLAAGIWMFFWENQSATGQSLQGACIKVGAAMAALWLALPQLEALWTQTPRWLIIATAAGLGLIVLHPLMAITLVPMLIVLWTFGPRVHQFVGKVFSAVKKKPRRR